MNIKIKEIEIECGSNIVKNDYYIEHFKNQGKDISTLLNTFGKNERRVAGEHDTSLSLGIKAAQKVLKKANLNGNDIDMIIFSSQLPEYTFPTQALIVHREIGGKSSCLVLDCNVNCLGMISAIDTAVRYLREKNYYNRALVIGADCMTRACDESNEHSYPMFGDCASAVILEKTEEDCGMVGSTYRTNSDYSDEFVRYPQCGYSSIYNEELEEKDKRLLWQPFDATFVPQTAKDAIDEVLEKHNLKQEQINTYCVSQFALPMLNNIANELGEPTEKFIYVGDKYGYTGTSSPFMALYEGINSGKIKRGDYVVFWSVAVYWTTCAMIFRY